jgi:hypothetical protein
MANQDLTRLRRHAEEGEYREARCREKKEDRKPPGRLIGSHRPGEEMPSPVTVHHPGEMQVLLKRQAEVQGSGRPLKTWCRPAPVAWTCSGTRIPVNPRSREMNTQEWTGGISMQAEETGLPGQTRKAQRAWTG